MVVNKINIIWDYNITQNKKVPICDTALLQLG